MEENRTITIGQYYGSLPNMKSKFDRFARKDFFKGKTREEWEKWALASRKALSDLLGLDKGSCAAYTTTGRNSNS